jgi:hypothetical protein
LAANWSAFWKRQQRLCIGASRGQPLTLFRGTTDRLATTWLANHAVQMGAEHIAADGREHQRKGPTDEEGGDQAPERLGTVLARGPDDEDE